MAKKKIDMDSRVFNSDFIKMVAKQSNVTIDDVEYIFDTAYDVLMKNIADGKIVSVFDGIRISATHVDGYKFTDKNGTEVVVPDHIKGQSRFGVKFKRDISRLMGVEYTNWYDRSKENTEDE